MLIVGLSLILQLALIVHVFRTGRPVYWAFIIFFLSFVGSLAYIIVELLPDMLGDPRARGAMRSLKKTVNPGADLRRKERLHQLSGSVDAARHLAVELIEAGKYVEAIEHFENALTGIYENDPDLLLGLAQAQFGNQEFAKARATLERITEHNPEFKSSEGHLLYARAAEECGDLEAARHEYEAVSAYFAGAEAKLRYAALLEKTGDTGEAASLLEDIVKSAELAPRHYRKAQRKWIVEAKEGLRRLNA
jgi:hypothetical protein